MNTEKSIRLVCYPAIVNDDLQNLYGFFMVEFSMLKPVRASLINTATLHHIEVVMDQTAQMWDCLFNHDTLYCLNTVDNLKDWNGTLNF